MTGQASYVEDVRSTLVTQLDRSEVLYANERVCLRLIAINSCQCAHIPRICYGHS